MKNTNLPAVKEINIFTSQKNVNQEIVQTISEAIKQAKKISLQGAKGFDIGIHKRFENLSFDTVMYMFEQYGFTKPQVQTSWNNTIYIVSEIRPKNHICIRLESEHWDVKLMPCDVKQFI